MDISGLMLAVALPALVALALVMFLGMRRHERRVDQVWRRFAAAYGLHQRTPARAEGGDDNAWDAVKRAFDRDPIAVDAARAAPLYEGTNRGQPFQLARVYVRKQWTNGYDEYTRLAVALPDLPQDVRLRRARRSDRLLQAVGAPTVRTGDPRFDETATLTAKDGEAARAYFTLDRREALRRYLSTFPGELQLYRGHAVLARKGAVAEYNELTKLYAHLGDLAGILSM